MPDNTCFKLNTTDGVWLGMREQLQTFGTLYQVFVQKELPNIVNVKYKQASAASQAMVALANDPHVLTVEPMDEWPFVKKPKPQPNTTGEILAKHSPWGESSENIRRPILNPGVCNKCFSDSAELICTVCAAWYCNEQCQLSDWVNHRMNCIPRLVRGFPVLNALQNRVIKTTMQQQAQQGQQHQAQQRAQQQQQQAQQGQQHQAQQRAQQQQQQAQQQQQQAQQRAQQQQQQAQQRSQQQQAAQQQAQQLLNEQLRKPKAYQTMQTNCQPDRPVEALSNGVQQKAKDNLKHKKPNASEQPDKENEHNISADKLDANVVKPVTQGPKQQPVVRQMKEQQNITKQPAQPAQPALSNKPVEQTLQKQKPTQPKAAATPSVASNGPKKATQGLEQPAAAPKVTDGPPKVPKVAGEAPKPANVSSFLQKKMQTMALAKVTKRTLAYSAFPAVGSTVAISFVAPNAVYIHEASDESTDPFVLLINRSIQHGREIKNTLMRPPVVDDIVFAPFGGSYYRAIVTQVLGDEASVLYPDFGNTDVVQWKVIKEIQDQAIKYANCITHSASLFTEWPLPPAVHDFLSGMVEQDAFELTRVETNPSSGEKTVELRHLEANYLLSAKIREIQEENESSLAATIPVLLPVHESELLEAAFPNDGITEVEVTIIEASEFTRSHLLSVILASNDKQFAEVLLECAAYSLKDPCDYREALQPGYACLVQYENTWSRALNLLSDADDQMFLLDFGIIRSIDKMEGFRQFPATISRQLYCTEYLVDNPEILTEVAKADDQQSTSPICGWTVKAKLHVDECNVSHMKITSIIGNAV